MVGQVAQLEAETALVALRGLASLSKELLEECRAEATQKAPAAGTLLCFHSLALLAHTVIVGGFLSGVF